MARGRKLRVGVLFGGRSSEHEISLRSALTVMSAMDPERYQIVPIAIDHEGHWFLEKNALKVLAQTTPDLGALSAGDTPVMLLPHNDSRSLVPTPSKRGVAAIAEKNLGGPLDVVFPVLHGTFGEDGTVQGLLELAGVPYVGAGVLGSAIGMDKDTQKRVLRDAGVPVVNYHSIIRADYEEHPALAKKFARELGYPVVVKPDALGSSIGISRVKRPAGLDAAMQDAFQYDRKALIEESCEGRELECAVLGNHRPEASTVGEIVITHGHEFYSYESKYVDAKGSEIRIPAKLPKAALNAIRKMAVEAFKALSLRGMARVDFLARRDLKKIYVNEVNTIPGFTS